MCIYTYIHIYKNNVCIGGEELSENIVVNLCHPGKDTTHW